MTFSYNIWVLYIGAYGSQRILQEVFEMVEQHLSCEPFRWEPKTLWINTIEALFWEH